MAPSYQLSLWKLVIVLEIENLDVVQFLPHLDKIDELWNHRNLDKRLHMYLHLDKRVKTMLKCIWMDDNKKTLSSSSSFYNHAMPICL